MKKDVVTGMVWAGSMLLLALAAVYARKQGYIDSEGVQRIVAMNGLMIAYYGNQIPKKVAPSAAARQAMRVSGWSLVLSGLVYAGLWAFAPIPVAVVVGTAVLVSGVVLSMAYCLSLRSRVR